MNLSAPHSILLAKEDGAVLTVLSRTNRPLSGREVAKLSGGSVSTVARVLRRLSEHGVVDVFEAGAALLHTLNRQHLACEPLVGLLNMRRRLFDRISEQVATWHVQPVHASVFGSAARGDGGTKSDVDVLVVRAARVDAKELQWRGPLDSLTKLILNWTGNRAALVEISELELVRLRRERPAVVEELERDSVRLVGPTFQELLAGSPN